MHNRGGAAAGPHAVDDGRMLERQAGALAREREQAPQVFDRYVTAVVAGRA